MEQAIEQLYQPLFNYVKKRVNNAADAEDLTQEVFYKFSKANNDEVSSMKSWLYTIAKNTITDYYRKKKIMSLPGDIEEIPHRHEEEEPTVVEELSKCIVEFILQLPEDYRTMMIMSELEEVPQKEIATKLNMNYVTVRSKIQRGRKKLKGLLSSCCVIEQGGKGSILRYAKRPDDKDATGCCPQTDYRKRPS